MELGSARAKADRRAEARSVEIDLEETVSCESIPSRMQDYHERPDPPPCIDYMHHGQKACG